MGMWPLSLTVPQRQVWLDGITTDVRKRVSIMVTDRSWKPIGSVTLLPTALQTTIDTSADTQRRLDIEGVEAGALLEQSWKRLWHVTVDHHIPSLGWVPSPVGVYVPNRVTRQGREGSASLPDLEALWASNLPRNQHGVIGKGAYPLRAARELLTDLGVPRFRWPAQQIRESDGKGGTRLVRTMKRWAYGGESAEDRPIPVIRRMLRAHGYQFFFDGAGNAVARPLDNRPRYDFDPFVFSDVEPIETTEWLKAHNRVLVTSGSGDKVMYGRASLPDWHPASAVSRAVNGVPQVHTLHVNSEARKQSVLDAQARAHLDRQVDQTREVTATCLPIPLDPEDFVSITVESGPAVAPVRQCSTDWMGDGGMEIGIARRIIPVRRRAPRRRR